VTGSAWLVVWSGFIAEYLWLAWAHGAAKTRWFYALFPFARLVAPRLSDPRQRWLPVWGWCIGNTALVEALQKRLDWPLIGVALLILPVLLGEFLLVTPEQHPAWLWIFDLVEHAIIWLAFALEFTLLLALSRDKLAYAIQRWMDIVIILLPLVSFLRVLRLARLLKMGQLARAYRLRVLTRRSVLLAMALWRLIAPHLPRNYLRELHKLRQQLAANHRAHELLEQKITALLAEHRQAVKPSD
jgi:voltage-gated potassium channel